MAVRRSGRNATDLTLGGDDGPGRQKHNSGNSIDNTISSRVSCNHTHRSTAAPRVTGRHCDSYPPNSRQSLGRFPDDVGRSVTRMSLAPTVRVGLLLGAKQAQWQPAMRLQARYGALSQLLSDPMGGTRHTPAQSVACLVCGVNLRTAPSADGVLFYLWTRYVASGTASGWLCRLRVQMANRARP